MRRKLEIKDVRSIIRSLISNEIILHFPGIYDFRATFDSADRRDDFLNLVKLRFAHLVP
jgi:hypothetical protein